jgi:putative (di)nucleoside polyphosphate hydrolase
MNSLAKPVTQPEITTSCGTLIIDSARRILLCHVTGMNHWDIPKGIQEPGEPAFETAKRELREETGLEFDDALFEELGNYDYQKTKRLHLYRVYAPEDLIGLDHLRCNSYFAHRSTGQPTPEMDGYRWAARTEVRTLCTLPMAERLLSLDW